MNWQGKGLTFMTGILVYSGQEDIVPRHRVCKSAQDTVEKVVRPEKVTYSAIGRCTSKNGLERLEYRDRLWSLVPPDTQRLLGHYGMVTKSV
jgi:hypothetical protein